MISEKEFRRRKKISDTLKENSYWKGKKLTKKHIQKITENHWDKKDTEDVKKIKEKISEKTKIGMDKPEVKEKLRNQFLGTTLTTEHIQKIKDALNFPEIKKKHIGSYTIEIRKKISDRVKNAFINNPNLREISRRTLTKLMKNKKFRQKSIYSIRNTSPTKPEIVVDNILKKHNLGFEFVGNGKFWINYKNNNFNPDFINKKNKTIISFWLVLA